MLKKVVSIKNVGKFRRCAAVKGGEFDQVVLAYAPNGQGKTTFCDIMRSLRDNDGAAIAGRKTLDSDGEPEVQLLLNDGLATFSSGSWSRAFTSVQVFDEQFVYSNVHAGESVEHEQRRNLHDVIIGERGVELRKKVDSLDVDLRAARQVESKCLAAAEDLIPGLVPGATPANPATWDGKLMSPRRLGREGERLPPPGWKRALTTKAFVALKIDADLEAKTDEARRTVRALEQASDVRSKELLSSITTNWPPFCLPGLLGVSLEDVEASVEDEVRAHFEANMQTADESWAVRGVALLKSERCPFCAQGIDGNELLSAYKVLFGQAYQGLSARIGRMRQAVESVGDEGTLRTLERVLTTNVTLLDEWRAFTALDYVLDLDVDGLEGALRGFRRVALDLLDQKRDSPLKAMNVGESFANVRNAMEKARSGVDAYNRTVELVNNELSGVKDSSSIENLEEEQLALATLEATGVRHSEGGIATCDEYKQAVAKRKAIELRKQAARNELEAYSDDVFERHQLRINELLEAFSADFRIGKTSADYVGGKPRSKYCLVICSEEVELGDAKTPRTKPSFKNTLSGGDKSALAFAFFISQLDEREDLAQQVVILDDPFTSQDRARQFCTKHEIVRIAGEAGQVIVLSHNQGFLHQVWRGLSNAVSIQFSGLSDTAITSWDVEALMDEYRELYSNVWMYCNRNVGEPRAVAHDLRLLLEGYLRNKLPFEFGEDDNLGTYVRDIDEAEEGTAKAMAKGLLPKLRKLNEYSREHHHFKKQGGPEQPVDAREVLTLGKLALSVVEGF